MKSSELRAPLGVEERKLVKAIKAFIPSGTDTPDAAVLDAFEKTFSDKTIQEVKDYYQRKAAYIAAKAQVNENRLALVNQIGSFPERVEVQSGAVASAAGSPAESPLITEYGFQMTPSPGLHFDCGELSFKPKPGELRRTVADKLNAELAARGLDYRIDEWLLERGEMNQPFGKNVVQGLVGKDSNKLDRQDQKGQMPPGSGFTNRAEWVILQAFHRLKTNGEDHSLEELAFRTDPFAVWSDARGVYGSGWGYSDVLRFRVLFAARSRISGS